MAIDWRGPAVIAAVRRGALAGVVAGIGIVERRAVQLILSPPKSGRVYRRRGVEHQASAPGEAPANDRGDLVKNRTIKIDAAAIRAVLTFHAAHAIRLERGTRRMQPRPFARRALAETSTQVQDAIAGEIAAEIRAL